MTKDEIIAFLKERNIKLQEDVHILQNTIRALKKELRAVTDELREALSK